MSATITPTKNQRDLVVELADYLSKKLETLRPEEASSRPRAPRVGEEPEIGLITGMKMTNINRFSSRRQRLDHAFLADRLKGAKSYKRIAGYFRSSIFELVGEEIANIPQVQIVCNSELDAADVAVSKHVRETALKERWNEAPAEVEALLHQGQISQASRTVDQRASRDSCCSQGSRFHPWQSRCNRIGGRLEDVLSWFDQRNQECFCAELRNPLGRHVS